MILKKKGSKIFLVNLLADFIMNSIGQEHRTIIKVSDFGQFYVVKGKTSSKEILDLSEISLKFKNENSEFIPETKNINTIDLIEYGYKFDDELVITQTYYNSENCSYRQNQLDFWEEFVPENIDENLNKIDDNELSYHSEFPHGYSLSQGRIFYYYGKKIIYNIPPTYPFKSLTLTLSNRKNFHDEQYFKVFDNSSYYYDLNLESAIRDIFNFDTSSLEEEIKKVDLSLELINPLEDFEILKEKVGGFIIL